jgi:RimJ/RimL family protein N-acetyltransferase
MNLQIRLAENTETKEIIQLLKEVAAWLKSEEIDQWSYLLSGGEDQEIELAILKEETYVAEYENNLIGTFTISPLQSEWDFDLWGDIEGSAIYLHRLAVNTDYKGQGFGQEMIQWIEKHFFGQFMYLRLDCVSDNPRLNQFYKDCGFTFVGTTDGFNKYEKHL